MRLGYLGSSLNRLVNVMNMAKTEILKERSISVRHVKKLIGLVTQGVVSLIH